MALEGKLNLSQDEVSQEIDLEEIFGRDVPNDVAQEFAREAIERIIERSQSGEDNAGKSFKSYTKKYADIKGSDEVDMTLFGDMLGTLDFEVSGNKIKVKIADDQAPKAYGHMTGYKGHPTIINGPKRKFFGISTNEAETIAESLIDRVEAEPLIPLEEIFRRVTSESDEDIIRRIISSFNLTLEE